MQSRRTQSPPNEPGRIKTSEDKTSEERNGASRANQIQQALPVPEAAERLLAEKDERIASLERSLDFLQTLTHRHHDLLERQMAPPSPSAPAIPSRAEDHVLADPRKDSILGSFWGGIFQQAVIAGVSLLSLWMASQFRNSHDRISLVFLLAAGVLSLGATAQRLTCLIRRKAAPGRADLISSLSMTAAGACALAFFLRVLWITVSPHPGGHLMFFQMCFFEIALLAIVATTGGAFKEAVSLAMTVRRDARDKDAAAGSAPLRVDSDAAGPV